jgi:CheY-like chemotaxis protein
MLTDLMGGEMSVRSTPGQGTMFTVRLFLPELRDMVVQRPTVQAMTGYAGPRRRLLVVDNEEADRELVTRWLQPLGFEVQMATSGDDALRRLDGLQPGDAAAPHVILLDLAMPGIDGWETRRRLLAGGWSSVPMAIVSANAFDKGLLQTDPDHGQGLLPQDFLVKPVRREELLGWLGRQLSLDWIEVAEADRSASGPVPLPTAPADEAALFKPGEEATLLECLRLGYARGVLRWLDEWAASGPAQAQLAAQWRQLAREFRFEAIEEAVMKHAKH